MKVAVLLGGLSRERPVSLKTGAAVADAVRRLGHDVVTIDVGKDVAVRLMEAQPDIAFIALHGRFGEDGTVQGLLELMGIPYTGSGVLASAASMNKAFTKNLFRAAGLPTPASVVVKRGENISPETIPFTPPYIVKPSCEGSSFGLTMVRETQLLADAVAAAHAQDEEALVERFITGTEITVGILGAAEPFALPPIEIVPKSGVYDYQSKYTVGATDYIIPPRLALAAIARCQALALAAHTVMGCSGMSRVDLLVNDEETTILEINTIPGMTETSLLPKAARSYGLEFPAMIAKILEWGLEARR